MPCNNVDISASIQRFWILIDFVLMLSLAIWMITETTAINRCPEYIVLPIAVLLFSGIRLGIMIGRLMKAEDTTEQPLLLIAREGFCCNQCSGQQDSSRLRDVVLRSGNVILYILLFLITPAYGFFISSLCPASVRQIAIIVSALLLGFAVLDGILWLAVWYRSRLPPLDLFYGKYDKFPKVDQCPICLSPFLAKDRCSRTRCGHLYHRACLDAWLARHRAAPSCPMCRAAISPAL